MAKHNSMAASFFDRIILQHPRIVALCVLAAAGFLTFQARHFRLDASAETLVLENEQDLRYSRLISSRYGQQDFLLLTYTPKGDLFAPDTLARLARLRGDLKSLERILSVLSILDVPLLESPPVSLKELNSALPTLESPTVDMNLARIELRQSPLYQNLLLSPDLKTTALLINFADDDVYRNLLGRRNELRQKKASGQLSSAERAELKCVLEQFQQHRDKTRWQRHQDIMAIRTIMDNYRRDADLFLGGVSMIADDMITFIKNDLKVFGLGVLLFLILTLGIIFRRIRWICLPMLCCVVCAICMIGLLGWIGWEVTVISSNFISLQLIITMSLVIHLIVRYRELLVRNPQESNRRLILDTVQTKLIPSVYAFLTTIVGFASLLSCDILPVITFGWMMIVGLIVSLVVTFLLFPSVLMLMPKETLAPRLWRAAAEGRRFLLTSILARFTEAHGVLILGISGLVLSSSIIGISRLDVENCFIDYFNENTEIYKGMKVIDQYLGGTTPLDVIVDFQKPDAPAQPPFLLSPAPASPDASRGGWQESRGVAERDPAPSTRLGTGLREPNDIFDQFDEFDKAAMDEKYWFTPEKMARVKAVHSYLDSLPETGKVLSLATMLSIAEKLNGGRPLDSFELALLYSESSDKFKTLLIKPYVSVQHNQVRFWVRVRDSEKTLRRNEVLKKIKTDLTDRFNIDKEHVHLAGLLVLYNNMLQSLFDSQILTSGITFLVLMITYLVEFRSARIAVIAIIPNAFSIVFVLGMMGWLNIPLDIMTITIAAIGLGISDDFTIHYIHRFKQEFKTGGKYTAAMHRCHGSIGHAMFYTSITIIIGFSILAMSNFKPTFYFGLLTGLAMFIALLAALTLLPQLLILVKPFGKEQKTEDRKQKTEKKSLFSVLCLLSSGVLAVMTAGCAVCEKSTLDTRCSILDENHESKIENRGEDFDLLEEEVTSQMVEVADPLEPWNRIMYQVNDILYFWVAKPCAQVYIDVVPQPVRLGVRNFFYNLATPIRFVNCHLQGKSDSADTELKRFLVNTTAGILGFGDPARDKLGLEPAEEDLGQTLAVHRFGNGFYIVWPLIGPSTLRDSAGLLGDQFLNPTWYVEPMEVSIGISGVKLTNESSFHIGEYEAFKSAALDSYVAMRQAYIQYRNKQIKQ